MHYCMRFILKTDYHINHLIPRLSNSSLDQNQLQINSRFLGVEYTRKSQDDALTSKTITLHQVYFLVSLLPTKTLYILTKLQVELKLQHTSFLMRHISQPSAKMYPLRLMHSSDLDITHGKIGLTTFYLSTQITTPNCSFKS